MSGMQAPKITSIRLIKHEAVNDCGSFEVRHCDGRPSRYFYWDELLVGVCGRRC